MSTPIVLLCVAGAAIVLVLVVVLAAFIQSRRFPKASPPPLFRCPACGSDQIDIFFSGLWDGEDLAGRGTGGSNAIGTCKSCGVHCEQRSMWDHDVQKSIYHTSALTDAEWQRETAFSMKLRQRHAEWPRGDKHVA